MRLIFILAACSTFLVQMKTVFAQELSPSITIDSPHDFSTLVIKPPEVKLNNLFIQFTTENVPVESEICVIISAFGTSQNKPEQCISSTSNHIALSGLDPGHYVFQLIIKGKLDPAEYFLQTLEVLRVAVKTVEDSLPDLDFSTHGDMFFIKQDDQQSVDVSLDLTIAESMLYSVLDLCVEVKESQEDGSPPVTISDVCTSLEGTPAAGTALSFTLPSIPLGDYEATLVLQSAYSPVRRMEKSRRSKHFRVVSRSDTLPLLVAPSESVEYMLESHQPAVEVHVPHSISCKDTSIVQADNVQVCLRLYTPFEGDVTSSEIGSDKSNGAAERQAETNTHQQHTFSSCMAVRDSGLLRAGALGEGIHHYELVLKDGIVIVASSEVTGVIDIRRPQEFEPSFAWQPLHAWHTAPKGIEIRLPVGGTGLKEARVPEPWRLQLSMPHPCKFFLRMDTFRDTTVGSIRTEAAKKCNVLPHCLVLEAPADKDDMFGDEETVLTSQMYKKKLSLEFNSSCVEDDDDEDFDMSY